MQMEGLTIKFTDPHNRGNTVQVSCGHSSLNKRVPDTPACGTPVYYADNGTPHNCRLPGLQFLQTSMCVRLCDNLKSEDTNTNLTIYIFRVEELITTLLINAHQLGWYCTLRHCCCHDVQHPTFALFRT